MEREALVETPDGPMRTFVTAPESDESFPVALIYLDGPGYRPAIKDVARRLAHGGYFAVLPDLYRRVGSAVAFDVKRLSVERDQEELTRLANAVAELTWPVVASYTQAVLDMVVKEPRARPGPKVCAGYCMGAAMVLRAMAAFPDQFVAGTCIHPSRIVTAAPDSPHLGLAQIRGSVYFGFAEHDAFNPVTPELLELLETAADRHAVPVEIDVHPGTSHGFALADLPVHEPQAAERHYERTLALWQRCLDRHAI
jgi:carboxymethylenebutenolidase